MTSRRRRRSVKIRAPRLYKRHQAQPGQPPGTLVYDRPPRVDKVSIRVIDYGADACAVRTTSEVEDTFRLRDSDTVSWIDVEGLHDTDLLNRFGSHFGLHPLVLEDILNTHQRPKIEEYDDYLYMVVRMLAPGTNGAELHSEQVSIILARRFVITFQEIPGDVFDPLRKRIDLGKGRVRRMGTDYLVYSIIDTIVDNYFLLLEKIAERIEEIEDSITASPQPEDLSRVHQLRRELVYLRRNIWPLRDVVISLERSETELVSEDARIYIRDLHDHVVQVIESLENFRDVLASLQDLYASSIGQRTNEVIRVLTIISTIFVPLTFLAGVYGMNFDILPELHWRHGYFAFWAVSVVLVASLIAFLRSRRWI
ncbi:MAG: magnesium/cobalt transporter CorA [Candidatus Krumholzibacteria bacterium]|nr:magnesium/cobalt transporter CorA [Candidatus Krumholzibacteria bacterium]MDH4336714.1 magnesium/cobalt transporter CorA [Candidatus Krumholzibacteria bacterium]MDH5270743.1 magnesium/cobalt transporter CorA [Candidatus Krumholzibacteria bacterium]